MQNIEVADEVLQQPIIPAKPLVSDKEVSDDLITQKIVLNKASNDHSVSALSLKGLKLKKEREKALSKINVNLDNQPKDDIEEETMLMHWNSYADQYYKTGRMLMASIMRMSLPKLSEHTIILELPNEGSKLSFDENKYDLVNGLRKKLNNYSLDVRVVVNETIEIRKAFTIEDKYQLLLKKNATLDLLRTTFDLDLKL